MSDDDNVNEVMNRCLHELGERFEAVQILATRTQEGMTHTVCRGVGNWHARIGLAHAFIESETAQENAMQIAAALEDDDK